MKKHVTSALSIVLLSSAPYAYAGKHKNHPSSSSSISPVPALITTLTKEAASLSDAISVHGQSIDRLTKQQAATRIQIDSLVMTSSNAIASTGNTNTSGKVSASSRELGQLKDLETETIGAIKKQEELKRSSEDKKAAVEARLENLPAGPFTKERFDLLRSLEGKQERITTKATTLTALGNEPTPADYANHNATVNTLSYKLNHAYHLNCLKHVDPSDRTPITDETHEKVKSEYARHQELMAKYVVIEKMISDPREQARHWDHMKTMELIPNGMGLLTSLTPAKHLIRKKITSTTSAATSTAAVPTINFNKYLAACYIGSIYRLELTKQSMLAQMEKNSALQEELNALKQQLASKDAPAVDGHDFITVDSANSSSSSSSSTNSSASAPSTSSSWIGLGWMLGSSKTKHTDSK